jgi:hypothetical protein
MDNSRFTGTKLQKKVKNWGAEANFSLFTLHFSLFFVPLHPLSRDGGMKFNNLIIQKFKIKHGNKNQIAARWS